jgi:hypothetical protein
MIAHPLEFNDLPGHFAGGLEPVFLTASGTPGISIPAQSGPKQI